MSHDNQEFYRTTPARTGKMMAIMLGICIIGGAIFFGLWDYWISEPAPVVAMMAGDSGTTEVAVHTGATITSDLSFIESSDFITLAFNALPGEPGNNPTINMEVGDKVIFNVVNDGVSFHSFGVTKDTEGFGGIIPGSEVASPTSPLKSGEGGSSEFIAGEEGVFYYICTVSGHREQGMVGKIIVGDVAVEKVVEEVATPEPMEEETKPMKETKPVSTEPVAYDGPISLPEGSGVVGCQETNECYIPYHVTAHAGTEIVWSNDDTAAHTVTSGSLPDGPDGIFDSSILASGLTFSVTLDEPGEYPYYCIVHPWMVGNITIE